MRGARILLLAVLLAILALALMPLVAPPVFINHIDKLEHMAAFAMLWLLGRRAGVPVWWLALGLLGYGALIEVAQGTLTTTREADVLDWLADAAGIALGAGLEWVWLRRRRGRMPR